MVPSFLAGRSASFETPAIPRSCFNLRRHSRHFLVVNKLMATQDSHSSANLDLRQIANALIEEMDNGK
jgi:hypothetical protein